MDSRERRSNNLIIAKTLVEYNVAWPTEEKLSITPSPAPASSASMCPAGVRELATPLTRSAVAGR